MKTLYIVMRTGPAPGERVATQFSAVREPEVIRSTKSWWFETQAEAYEFCSEQIRLGTRCHYSIHEAEKGEKRV